MDSYADAAACAAGALPGRKATGIKTEALGTSILHVGLDVHEHVVNTATAGKRRRGEVHHVGRNRRRAGAAGRPHHDRRRQILVAHQNARFDAAYPWRGRSLMDRASISRRESALL